MAQSTTNIRRNSYITDLGTIVIYLTSDEQTQLRKLANINKLNDFQTTIKGLIEASKVTINKK